MTTALSLTKAQENALQRHLEAIDDAKSDMVRGAVTIGLRLIDILEIVPKKGFGKWVEDNCQFSRSGAYRFIQVAKSFGTFPKIENFQDSALYVLIKSDEAVKRAKAMATRGKRITHEMAKEIMRELAESNGHVEPENSPKVGTGASQVIDVESVAVPEIPVPEVPEREPGDDTEAIAADKAKRKASGKEVVPAKLRKTTLKAFGVVVRFFDQIGQHDQYRAQLDSLLTAIKGGK